MSLRADRRGGTLPHVRIADIVGRRADGQRQLCVWMRGVGGGVRRATAVGMRQLTTLENAFTDTLMDLEALRRTDFDLPALRRRTNEIDFAVGRLCDEVVQPTPENVDELARRAYRAVLELAQLLEPASSDDRRTRDKLDLTRDAVAALLDALARLVSHADHPA